MLSTTLHLAAAAPVLALAIASSQTSTSALRLPAELEHAEAFSRAGAQVSAERILLEYLSRNPTSAKAHALLGLVKYREGVPDKSLDHFSLAAKYGRLNADDLRIAGLDYLQLHDLPHSEQWLKESIRKNPNDWRTWRYLGGVQYSEERPLEAASSFKQCLQLDPGNALAEDGLARSDEALGNADAAEEYRLAVTFNSRSAQESWLPLLHYGSYLRRTSHLEEALSFLRKAQQLAPDDWEPHAESARAYEDLGALRSAESELQNAIALAPDRIRLHYLLGRIYQREGKRERATQEFDLYQEAASKNPRQREFLDR